MRTFLILISLGILSIAGCGGGSDKASTSSGSGSGETGAGATTSTTAGREYHVMDAAQRAQVAVAIRGYYLALAADDAGKACSFVASAAKQQLTAQLSQSPKLKEKGCPGVVKQLTKDYPASYRAALKHVAVTKAFIKGDVVLARYKIPGERLSLIPMRRDHGAWRVTALAGVQADQVPIP